MSVNNSLAAIIFENIQQHGFLSAGTSVIDAIVSAVDQVDGIGDYLDSRFKPATTFTNTSQRPFLDSAIQTAQFS